METTRRFSPSPTSNPVVLLSADELARELSPQVCFEALHQAYIDLAADPECMPKSLGFNCGAGTYHVKAALYPRVRDVIAAKLNANFPGNAGSGLPTVQGLVFLGDAGTGVPLAVMDSGELTARRTAATAALAARFGARPDSRSAAFIGCGRQAGYVLRALARILPIDTVRAFDADAARAAAFASAFKDSAIPPIEVAEDVAAATRGSDVIVTCTTAAHAVLRVEHVRAGAFIAAIGADNPNKQEIDPGLFEISAVLVDDRGQCASSGDLHHALVAGSVTEACVRADLCELVTGSVRARHADDEILLFDSTGTGLQDVAAARAAYLAVR